MPAELALILARSRNGVIGKNGVLPWHLPEDLAHFRRLTVGCPVLMGRATWDSLPPRFRPLPARRNIVLTRQHDWHAAGAERAADAAHALALCGDAPLAWVIGGAQVYAAFEPFATRAAVTEIDIDVAGGDAFAPQLGARWREVGRSSGTAADGLEFSFVEYRAAPPENPTDTADPAS